MGCSRTADDTTYIIDLSHLRRKWCDRPGTKARETFLCSGIRWSGVGRVLRGLCAAKRDLRLPGADFRGRALYSSINTPLPAIGLQTRMAGGCPYGT